MEENIKNNMNNRYDLMISIADMIERSFRGDESRINETLTLCQFFMLQDISDYSDEEMLNISGFIRKKTEEAGAGITDEYIITEIFEKDLEKIARPSEKTFFEKNAAVVRSVFEKNGIKYRELHPCFDLMIFELCSLSRETGMRGFRIETVLDRPGKICKVIRKSKAGDLPDEDVTGIADVLSETELVHMLKEAFVL